MNIPDITVDEAKELLNYNPLTGVFSWALSRRGCRKGDQAGYCDGKGYRQICLKRHKHIAEHRLAWFMVYGKWPRSCIDHINGVRDDNRIENLREATVAENGQNLARKNNKTGYSGVRYHSRSGTWVARITVNRREIYLGHANTPKAAHLLYLAGKREHHTFQPEPRKAASG